jgi:hypothetical protein
MRGILTSVIDNVQHRIAFVTPVDCYHLLRPIELPASGNCASCFSLNISTTFEGWH